MDLESLYYNLSCIYKAATILLTNIRLPVSVNILLFGLQRT